MANKWKGGPLAAQKRYREKNKEKVRERKLKYYHKNREQAKKSRARYIEKNRKRVYAYNAKWQREKRLEYKMKVIEGYGGACTCCGETEFLFLQIHHPNNNGKPDRKKHGGNSYYFYRWITDNNFPSGYELLCSNCHLGIHLSGDGICPHKIQDQLC